MRLRYVLVMVLAGATLAPAAHADAVADDIAKAASAWQAHDSRATLDALEAAANVLRQARADQLEALLPPVPAGWTAETPKTSAVCPAVLGGGTSARRIYHSGPEQVEVQITTDNPMLQGMAALIANPLTNTPDVKTVTIGGQRASYNATDNSYMALVDGKVIVRVEGNPSTLEPVLRAFVTNVDFGALKRIAK